MAARQWTVVVAGNDATLVEVKAAVTGKTHVVTKVVISIQTHANAKFIRVQDSASRLRTVQFATDRSSRA